MIPAALALVSAVVVASTDYGVSPSADLTDGWRVRTDAARAGIAGRWDAAGLNDNAWVRGILSRSSTGEVVWYRRWVAVPEGWPRFALVLEAVAGRVDLWVNGVAVGRDLVRQRSEGGAVVLNLARLAGGKPRCLLALRVAPGDDGPGTVGGVRLVPEPRPWLPGVRDRLRYAASETPDLPWPSWVRGEGAAWTAFADPDGAAEGVIGWRGDLEGGIRLGAVSCWLYDRQARRLYAAPAMPCQLRLEGRYLPLPAVTMRAGKAFALTVSAWPAALARPGRPPIMLAVGEALAENVSDRPREVDLVIAVHPFSVRGEALPVRRIRYDRSTQAFWVNDRPALVLAGTPDAAGAAPFDGDSSGGPWALVQALARGELPPAREAEDGSGLASAAAVYHLRIQPFGFRTQSFRFFLSGAPEALPPDLAREVREFDRPAGWRDIRARWQKLIAGKERIFLRVPDKTAQDAFYASAGHLLVALAAGRIGEADRPLVAAALLRAGHAASATTLAPAATGWGATPPVLAGSLSASALTDGTWRPADSLAGAWGAARGGDGAGAWRVLGWWVSHPTTPGACAWSGRADPATGRFAGGELPDPRAAAGFICTLRDMLIREDGGALWLAPALPAAWMRPGDIVDVRHVPTAFGILPGFVVATYPNETALRRLSAERVANRGRGPVIAPEDLAHPPDGFRWRVPGGRRIRQVRIDGVRVEQVPADRVLVLSEGFREVRVEWRPVRTAE